MIVDTNKQMVLPLGFAAGLHDKDTGLVHFGYREYDPSIGRFITPDPLGLAGGDVDVYGYCADDPVNGADPLGLWGDFGEGIGGAGGRRSGVGGGSATSKSSVQTAREMEKAAKGLADKQHAEEKGRMERKARADQELRDNQRRAALLSSKDDEKEKGVFEKSGMESVRL